MPDTSGLRPPKVFISYSHDSPEHGDRVLDLANQLRLDGIDARCDQYETCPPEGWQLWMERQLRDADFVLMICSSVYRRRAAGEEEPGQGLGVTWEGKLIRQYLYEAGAVNKKFIPVLLADCRREDIPMAAKGTSYFDLQAARGYEDLYRLLTNQRRALIPELGKLRRLAPRARRSIERTRDMIETTKVSPKPEPKKPIPEPFDCRAAPKARDPKPPRQTEDAGGRSATLSWRLGSIVGGGALAATAVGVATAVLFGGSTGGRKDEQMEVRIYAGGFSREEYSVLKNGNPVGTTNNGTKPYVPLTLDKDDIVLCRKPGHADLSPQPIRAGGKDYYCEKP